MKEVFQNKTIKLIIIILCDLLALLLSIFLSICITDIHQYEFLIVLQWAIVNIVLMYIIFVLFNLYSVLFSSVSLIDAVKVIVAVIILFALNVIYSLTMSSISIEHCFVMCFSLSYFALIIRFSKKLILRLRCFLKKFSADKKRVMIIGAGSAGLSLIVEMQSNTKLDMIPVCLLDDDRAKLGKFLSAVKVVGCTNEVVAMAKKYKTTNIIVAMPSAKKEKLKDIYEACQKTNCKVQTLPSIQQLIEGEVLASKIRDVDVVDLLGREQVYTDLNSVMGYITDNVVLVTGGGGSIGSELCRQIAEYSPKQLIILDIYENNAYEIEQELKMKKPMLNLLTLIASIRDAGKIDSVFKKYKPAIVFNAAAHKHVPLMETSPNEAIKNNVFGTLNMARSADKYGVKRFVQISTDKAVNPTNIMGASKRICEMIIQTMSRHSKTEFVAVRFGNVLGSNGSVIPLFKEQIANGGPVTITHRDITRYFMTIPEAVQLVLQAGAYAKGGEIFVLDMGEPVKIYDLAVNLIKMSGLTPYEDIDILVTGLRAGEKLYEERLMAEEGLEKTANELINIGKPLDIDEDNLFVHLDALYKEAYAETDKMKELVKELVPTYTIDKNENNKKN